VVNLGRIMADTDDMRGRIALVVLTCALAAPAAAPAAVTLTAAPEWFPHSRSLFVSTAWTPKNERTTVTLVLRAGGQRIKTIRATGWLIGRKTFSVRLPLTLATGAKVALTVRTASDSGKRTVTKIVTLTR
jgi:hypothetical protein